MSLSYSDQEQRILSLIAATLDGFGRPASPPGPDANAWEAYAEGEIAVLSGYDARAQRLFLESLKLDPASPYARAGNLYATPNEEGRTEALEALAQENQSLGRPRLYRLLLALGSPGP